MSGFVYLWRDRKHKRYYIGCHWGTETDGYICSSNWMRDAYRRRPHDFKRRIITRVEEGRGDLIAEEYHWLSMIKDAEVGKRYYNLSKKHNGHWTTDNQKRLTVGQKISAAPNRSTNISKANKGRPKSDEHKEKLKQANLGKTLSEETKRKISEGNTFDYSDPDWQAHHQTTLAKVHHRLRTNPEAKRKLIDASKRARQEGKIMGMTGKKHSPEARERMRLSRIAYVERQKQQNA